jgi:hypothetical protein
LQAAYVLLLLLLLLLLQLLLLLLRHSQQLSLQPHHPSLQRTKQRGMVGQRGSRAQYLIQTAFCTL